MAHEILFDIAPDGSTKITVKGVKGKSCKALTKEFEEGLGRKVSDVDTKEAHEQEVVHVKNKS